jgi:C4-dicarboxylate transporter DctQ subunit
VNGQKEKLEHVLRLINRAMAWIAAALIIFMMLAISYSVIVRYVWDQPVAWVVEISSYLMLYITFLGSAWLLQQDGHVEVDLFVGSLPPRAKAVFKGITSFGGAIVGLILAWKGTAVTIDYFQRKVIVIGILDTPQFLLMAIIPLGGALLFVGFLLKIWNSWQVVFERDRNTGEEKG